MFTFKKELNQALIAAGKAGQRILKIYQTNTPAYQKSDGSKITAADIQSQKIIINCLKYFNYPIIAEEIKDVIPGLKKKFCWFIDPLDGTNDFLLKTGEFAVMIGLSYLGAPVVGVIYLPTKKIFYYAIKGSGAFKKKIGCPDQKLLISSALTLKQARFVLSRTHLTKQEKDFLAFIKPAIVRSMGSIGVKITAIADKRADIYFTFSDQTSLWDICAPQIILQEAGGVFSDIFGQIYTYAGNIKNSRGLIASNKTLHSKLIKKINACHCSK